MVPIAELSRKQLIYNIISGNYKEVELQKYFDEAEIMGFLKGADLYRADLRRANLKEANLRHTYFKEANLNHSDLTSAQLYKADLYEASFKGAIFDKADLYNAFFTGVSGCPLNKNELRLRGAVIY